MALVLAAPLIRADDSPSIDLFAGWGWLPYAYGGDPYFYRGDPYWRPAPYAGLSATLYGNSPWFPPDNLYGGYGWPPFWGCGYGVRLALKDAFISPPTQLGLLPDPPGSAPLELRDTEKERDWSQDLAHILKRADTDIWLGDATNAPPATQPESAKPTPTR